MIFLKFFTIYIVIAEVPDVPTTEIADSIPVSSCEDWQAAFGFSSKSRDSQDDDLGLWYDFTHILESFRRLFILFFLFVTLFIWVLICFEGFDPWDESSKGLADLLEKENSSQSSQPQRTSFSQPNPQNLPPGKPQALSSPYFFLHVYYKMWIASNLS